MSTRPRLIRSAPFWLLIAGSLASTAAGAYLLLDRLGGMDARLTDGTATSNDVYVGQIWAVLGAILVGAGLVGFALALTIGALRSLVPAPAVEVVEPPAWEEDAAAEVDAPAESPAEPDAADTESADDYGYESELGYEPNESEATTPAR
jgi:hypothetical protein